MTGTADERGEAGVVLLPLALLGILGFVPPERFSAHVQTAIGDV